MYTWYTYTSTKYRSMLHLFGRRLWFPVLIVNILLGGTIVNRTCSIHKNLHIWPFLLAILALLTMVPRNTLIVRAFTLNGLFFNDDCVAVVTDAALPPPDVPSYLSCVRFIILGVRRVSVVFFF